MEQRQPILFWGQSLLGIGHWQRLLTIVYACQDIGLPVALVHGAPIPAELSRRALPLHPLPYCYARDANAKELVDESGAPLTDAWWQGRAGALLEILQRVRPAVFVTELFPFGRWAFRRELAEALEYCAAQHIPVVCSLRDIVQPSSSDAQRAAKILQHLEQYYAHVLVHSDPDLVPLEASFTAANCLKPPMLHYTGYVTAGLPPPPEAPRQKIVVVSAGGGRFGGALLEAALQVWPHPAWPDHELWVVAGSQTPPDTFLKLQNIAAQHKEVRVFPTYPHLAQLFPQVALSISQAGYNTVLEVVASHTPALVVPFAEGEQQEQTLRARALQHAGVLSLIEAADFSADTLRQALYHIASSPAEILPTPLRFGLGETSEPHASGPDGHAYGERRSQPSQTLVGQAIHLHDQGAAVTAAFLAGLCRQKQ